MGNCCFSSFDSKKVATAKLVVHDDGELQEFSYPVKVSYLLQKYPTCFICNSDEVDFDDIVKAMDESEVLQPGQLYFALPLSRLKRPLQAEVVVLRNVGFVGNRLSYFPTKRTVGLAGEWRLKFVAPVCYCFYVKETKGWW